MARATPDGHTLMLGSTGTTGSAYAPDLPTIADSGLPGFDVTTWYGIFAPAGTPEVVLVRLHGEIGKAMQTLQIRAQLSGLGIDAASSESPAAFHAYRAAEVEKWGRLVRASGAKAE